MSDQRVTPTLIAIDAALAGCTHNWVRVPTGDLQALRAAYYAALREVQLLQEEVDRGKQ